MFFRSSLLILSFLSFFFPVDNFSQESTNSKIYLGEFRPYNTKKNPELENGILEALESSFEKYSMSTEKISGVNNEEVKQEIPGKDIFISGYYKKLEGENLSIYGQVYDPKTGYVIDVLSIEEDWASVLGEGIKLPADEILEEDSKIIEKFSIKLINRVRLNSGKKTKIEHINQYLVNHPISEKFYFPLDRVKAADESVEVFKLLEDLEVVTATRTKTKLRDAPAAVYVVTSKEIEERGYRTLSEALHDLPGFDFQHTYGIYPELIHQRGLIGENNRTLVYIDGIPDNNINEMAALAGTIRFPLHNVERIEVVSGPASSLYGANAFNGIINIITKDGVTSPGNHVSATYGAWESNFRNPGYSANFSSRGSVGDKISPFQYSVGAYYYKTDGPFMGNLGRLDSKSYDRNDPVYYLESKACGGTCNQDKGVGYYWSPYYNNSKEESSNITAKFSKGGFRFESINWQYLQGEGTFGNGIEQIDTKQKGLETSKFDTRNNLRRLGILYGLVGTEGFGGSNWDFRNNTISSGYNHSITPNLNIDTEMNVRTTQILSSSHEEYPNSTGPSAYYRPGDVSKANNYARPDYNYQFETKLQYDPSSTYSTIIGIMGMHTVAAKDYGSDQRYTFNNFSGYVQQVYRPFDKVSFTGGYRYDEFTTFGNASSPRVSAIFKPTKDLTLKLLYGRGFRAPTVKELFAETKQRKNNPSLKPEQMQSYELGIGYRFLGRFYSSLHGYYNKVNNLILEVTTTDSSIRNGISPSAGTWQQNQNLGEAKIYGAELANSFQILENLKFNLNYSRNEGFYEKLPASLPSSPSTTGRPGDNSLDDLQSEIYKTLTGNGRIPEKGKIPNIAPHKVFVGITWTIMKDVSVYTGMNYVDIRRTKATNPVKTVGGYRMFKLNFRWNNFLKKGVYVQLQINNAGNSQYFDPGIRSASGSYYPTMHPLERRNFWLTLGYNF